MDYLVNGTEAEKEENDLEILMAIQLLKSLKTERGKKAAVEHIKLVMLME